MYLRTLAKTIHAISDSFSVLMVTGPRQVGKTTLLEICAKEDASVQRGYVTLDDMDARTLAQRDPALFLQTWPPPLIIDEIQYAPALFSVIKIIVDRDKRKGLFWLTGSQKFELMRGITESLAGRVAIIDMLGLSQAELDGRGASSLPFAPTAEWVAAARSASANKSKPLLAVFRQIWLGSYPGLNEQGPKARDLFYRSYIQTYIQRDVQDVLKVSDQTAFNRFLAAVAARTGQLLNYTKLARDVDVDNKTAKAWLSVLESSGLVLAATTLPQQFDQATAQNAKALLSRYRPGCVFKQVARCRLARSRQHVRCDAGDLGGQRNRQELLAQRPARQLLFLPRHRPARSRLVDRIWRYPVPGRDQKNRITLPKCQEPVCCARQTGQDHWTGRSTVPGRARHPTVTKRYGHSRGLPLAKLIGVRFQLLILS